MNYLHLILKKWKPAFWKTMTVSRETPIIKTEDKLPKFQYLRA